MTRISRYKLKDYVYEKMFHLLFEVVARSRDKEGFNQLIKELLSPTERIMIAKRVVLVYLLLQEIDYQIICRVLKVSSSTISKFKLLTDNKNGMINVLKKTMRSDKIKLFVFELMSDLFPPGMYGINWESAWKRKLEISKVKEEGISKQ